MVLRPSLLLHALLACSSAFRAPLARAPSGIPLHAKDAKPKKGADKPKAEAADKGAKARGAGRSSARAPADRPLAGGGTSKAPDGGDWLRTDVRAPPSNPAALTVAPVLPDVRHVEASSMNK